ncbi:c-type cytochrome [Caldimonas tepidiphila]|uniref:c-type cytochrome n=1 Tax=Caldimonas tepidiphila TaxID=2315841 RepID=UPI000E5BF395|nr:cytochrome c [Caldimonas tepidiphila]
MKRQMLALAATLAALGAMPTGAQTLSFAKAEDAIRYRQGAFNVMGAHFSRLGAMANGRVPFNAKAAAEHAEVVETLSRLPWSAFGEGTDKGAPHRAAPAVWSDSAKFRQGAERMQAEVAKLGTAAKSGNIDQFKAAFGGAAQSCKACHDNFRTEQRSGG